MPERLAEIAIADLIPTRFNPRTVKTDTDEHRELVESIKRVGVKVRVIARPHPGKTMAAGGKLELLAGARRTAAAKDAGLATIPAIIHDDISEQDAFEITFHENYGRKDLTPIEKGRAVYHLMTVYKNDCRAVAAKLGWSENAVRVHACIEQLSEKWKEEAEKTKQVTGMMSAAHLGLIARLPETSQDAFYADNDGWLTDTCTDEIPTTQELKRILAEFTMLLKAAPFDTDSCKSCRYRSDATAQMGLWGEEDDGKDLAKCLDQACWRQKVKTHLLEQYKELKAKYPDLVLIYGEDQASMKHRLPKGMKGILKSWKWAPAKKKEKKALPALYVNGPKVGKMIWVKLHDYAAQQQQQTPKKKQPPKKERLKTLQRDLDIKRWEKVRATIHTKVSRAALPKIQGMPEELGLLAMATAFGIRTPGWADAPRFTKLRKYQAKGGKAAMLKDLNVMVKAAILRAVPDRITSFDFTDARGAVAKAAELYGIDHRALYKAICETKGYTETKEIRQLKEEIALVPKKKPAAKKKATKPAPKKKAKKVVKRKKS